MPPRGSTKEASFGAECRREEVIRKRADSIFAFGIFDRPPPPDRRPEPGEWPEKAKQGRDRHDLERGPRAELLDHRPRIATLVSSVLVERCPECGIRGHGQEDPPPRTHERRRDSQQTDVVLHVLDHVEESDKIERSGKRRRSSLTRDDRERATFSRGGQVLEASFEAEGGVLPRERRENVPVSAAELQNSCAG